MAAEKVIPIEPGSDVDEFLRQADEEPVIALAHGQRFRVVREPTNDAGIDGEPDRLLANLARIAGLLKDVDVDALREELRQQRGQNSTGRPAEQ